MELELKRNKFKPNTLGKPVGCIFGLSLGGIGGGLIGFGLYSQSSNKGTKTYASGYAGLIVPVAMLGGMVIGAWQGFKLGPSIGNMLGDSSYVSQNQLVNLRDKSLNEKNILSKVINRSMKKCIYALLFFRQFLVKIR